MQGLCHTRTRAVNKTRLTKFKDEQNRRVHAGDRAWPGDALEDLTPGPSPAVCCTLPIRHVSPAAGEVERRSCQVVAMSCRRRSPRQIVVTPGSPSWLHPRNPPSWTIHRTASCNVSGVADGIRGVWRTQASACHACGSRAIAHVAVGFCRAASVRHTRRQATMHAVARAR